MRGGEQRADRVREGNKKHESEGRQAKREMDGLGAPPGLTVIPADVTQPRQGE